MCYYVFADWVLYTAARKQVDSVLWRALKQEAGEAAVRVLPANAACAQRSVLRALWSCACSQLCTTFNICDHPGNTPIAKHHKTRPISAPFSAPLFL